MIQRLQWITKGTIADLEIDYRLKSLAGAKGAR
jgi:hypothetical protein